MADMTEDFKKILGQNKTLLAKKAKEVSGGMMSDQEVCDALDLDEETRSIFDAKITRVGVGIDKNKNGFVMVYFTITSGPNKGVSWSTYHSLDKKNKERLERELSAIFRTYQRVGYDTTEWEPEEIKEKVVETAEEITASKPAIKIALSRYVPDDEEKPHRLNTNIIGLSGELEAPDTEEEEEEAPPKPSKAKAKTTAKAPAKGKAKAKPEPEPEPEEEEEEETEAEEAGPWIGYKATVDLGDGEVEVVTKSFEDGVYTIEYEDDEYEVDADDLTWIDE